MTYYDVLNEAMNSVKEARHTLRVLDEEFPTISSIRKDLLLIMCRIDELRNI